MGDSLQSRSPAFIRAGVLSDSSDSTADLPHRQWGVRPRSITEIPDELYLKIFSYVVSDLEIRHRASQLLQLCLVSRQFSGAALELLYEILYCPSDPEAATSLVRSLQANTELQRFVKVVYCKLNDGEDRYSYAVAQEFIQVAADIGFTNPTLWSDRSFGSLREATLALLILLTPNVSTVIKLSESHRPALPVPLWLDPRYFRASHSSTGRIYNLNCLRGLHMNLSSFPLCHLPKIFALPALHGLEYHSWYNPESSTEYPLVHPWDILADISSIEHLRLYFIHPECYRDVTGSVAACKTLISLHLTLSPAGGSAGLLSDVILTLRKHAQFLQSLQLEELPMTHYLRPSNGLLSVLGQFGVLRILRVPLYLLIGQAEFDALAFLDQPDSQRLISLHMLPASLETLVLDVGAGRPRRDRWDSDLGLFLDAMKNAVPASLPRLRRLRVLIKSFAESAEPLDFIRIRKKCAKLNVRFDWVIRQFANQVDTYRKEIALQEARGPDGIEIASRFFQWYSRHPHPDTILPPEDELFPSQTT